MNINMPEYLGYVNTSYMNILFTCFYTWVACVYAGDVLNF